MSRRNNRRAAAAVASVTILSRNSHETDTNSEDDEEWQSLLSAIIEKSKKVTKKRRKKSTPPAKRSIDSTKKKRKNISKSKNSIVHLDTDSEKSNDVSFSNIQKDVENKIDNFFKSSNLISDDEDDVGTTNIEIKLAPKESKEFYTLSDSDDDIKPTTSSINLIEHPVLDKSSLKSSEDTKIPEKNDKGSKDDLMELVDEILDCDQDVPIELNAEQDQSWSAYKNKTEEILGSVSALLNDLKKDNENPKEIVSKDDSTEKCKPSCPICLEDFGESVTAAATICGHIFCHKCIIHVAKTSKKCPTCRKGINLKKIHPVYL